jgi:hypothetical protein
MNLHPLASFLRHAALLVCPVLLAQEGVTPPPPVILLAREEVKPGHGGPHAAAEAAWAKALTRFKATDHYLGMTSLTGPSEAWFLMGYRSFADYEAKQNELDQNPAAQKEIQKLAQEDGEHLTGSRSVLATYRKDLSFGPDVEIGKMRYFRIRTFRIKQGQAKAFEEGMKLALAAYGKIHLPGSFAVYEVHSGMGVPSFLVLRPMKTLAELDVLETTTTPYREALGEEGLKAMQKTFGDAVGSVENQIFAFSPKLSFPLPSQIASDPAFWTVKED